MPQWPSRWGILYRGTLHLLDSEAAAEPLESVNIWNNRYGFIRAYSHMALLPIHINLHSYGQSTPAIHPTCCLDMCLEIAKIGNIQLTVTLTLYSGNRFGPVCHFEYCIHRRIVKVPIDAMAGTKHVVGVVPIGVDTNDAKDNSDSLLLRFPDQQQVGLVGMPHTCLKMPVTVVVYDIVVQTEIVWGSNICLPAFSVFCPAAGTVHQVAGSEPGSLLYASATRASN